MKKKSWEYKTLDLPVEILENVLRDELNRMGNDGWELCGIEYGLFIFKRECD